MQIEKLDYKLKKIEFIFNFNNLNLKNFTRECAEIIFVYIFKIYNIILK